MVAWSPCLIYVVYTMYFRDAIQLNGEDTVSSFRDQLEPEYSSSEERTENQGEEEEESILFFSCKFGHSPCGLCD